MAELFVAWNAPVGSASLARQCLRRTTGAPASPVGTDVCVLRECAGSRAMVVAVQAAPDLELSAAVDDTSTTAVRGARGSLTPLESPNGTLKTFTLSFGYLAGTTEVYLNGLLQRLGVDYVESDPTAGQIRFIEPPVGPSSGDPGDSIFVICQVNQA